jgi:DNA-binding NarL/FixJ family response regulator
MMSTSEKHHAAKAKTKILLVDDHPIVRQGLTQLIDHESDLSVAAQTDSEKVAIHAVETKNIDLAIIDISLVGFNGIDLAKKIKKRFPGLPVLMLTMHDEPIFAERAFHAGARGYILKREAPGKIITAIRIMLAGRQYITREVAQKLTKNDTWQSAQ